VTVTCNKEMRMPARKTLIATALAALLALFGAACETTVDEGGSFGDPGTTTDEVGDDSEQGDTGTDAGPVSPGTTGEEPESSDAGYGS
jgi:hypothetical protein